jgi:penicillin-binding protein 1A
MTQISRGRKTVLAKYGTKAYRTIGAGVAYEVNRILSDNATMGTGTRARTSDGRPQAGKTGTTDRSVDAWYCGYTPELATCVWVGYPNLSTIDGKRQLREMHGIEGLNGPYANVYGGTIPSEIWHLYMDEALKDEPPTEFREPTSDRRVVWRPFSSPWTRRALPPPAPRRATPPPQAPGEDNGKEKDKDKDKDKGGDAPPGQTLPTDPPPAATPAPAPGPAETTPAPAAPAPAGEPPPAGTGTP